MVLGVALSSATLEMNPSITGCHWRCCMARWLVAEMAFRQPHPENLTKPEEGQIGRLVIGSLHTAR